MTARADPASAAVPWTEGVLRHLNEAEVAAWMVDLGRKVVEHHGRYWMAGKPGFYRPVHILASLRSAEATPPTFAHWGFGARLAAPDVAAATAYFPAHMLSDLAGYDLGRLSSRRRGQVRRALNSMDMVVLTSPDILLDQGHVVACEANSWNPKNSVPCAPAFGRWVLSHFENRRGLFLVGLSHGRLLGFLSIWLADGVAYQDRLYVGTEGRTRHLSACLTYASAALASRHPHARELMNGLHLPQHPGISRFKHELGLRLTHVPARVGFVPFAGLLLRSLRPVTYYRVTGRASVEMLSPQLG